MAENRPREVPLPVMRLLEAVYDRTRDRPPSCHVGIDALGLGEDPTRNGAAILLAALSGWIVTGGRASRTVALTDAGIEMLRNHGKGERQAPRVARDDMT